MLMYNLGSPFLGSDASDWVLARENPWQGGPPMIPIEDPSLSVARTIRDTPVGPNLIKSATTAFDVGKLRLWVFILPSEFGILFDNFHTMRCCRLIWRDGDFVGAEFES
jgi:hypothetical protein